MDGIERTLIRRIFDAAPPDAIQLGLGQPDLVSPPAVCLAGVAAIAEGRTGYTSTAGDPELRAAVASRYHPWIEGPEGVVVTIGSQEAMFAACMTLLDPGDEVLYPDRLSGLPGGGAPGGRAGGAHPLAPARLSPDPDTTSSPWTEGLAWPSCAPGNPLGDPHAGLPRGAVRGAARRSARLRRDLLRLRLRGHLSVAAQVAPEGGLVVSGLRTERPAGAWAGRGRRHRGPRHRRAPVPVTCAPTPSQRAALAASARRKKPAGHPERSAPGGR
jgi:hypothetical protein